MVQSYKLTEEDYRGSRFADWATPLVGCNDILPMTAPHVIEEIHAAYFMAGADIVSTDTFNANSISMVDYGMQAHIYEMNRAAVSVARGVADRFTLENPSKPRFVAGSMGPTNRTASMSSNVNNPASREVTFDDLAASYAEQVRGMIDGGVDIFLVETIFDTLNAKAAVFAIEQACERIGRRIPVMISGTITDASGRTLSGQTVEAFYTSLAHVNPLSIGLNCALGAKQLKPYISRLSEIAECRISAHPNAGLPNVMGGYDETPEMMAADVESYMKDGLINIIGGCCGTNPAHISHFARIARNYAPRKRREKKHVTVLSGLERLVITPETNFVNVGERTNVAGSAKFARLIRENNYEEAMSIARAQVEAGAQIVDVCMDDGLINGVEAMVKFLNLAMSEPEIARVPFMIDSSKWEVLEAGLKCVQGKSVVNSISLKEGEEEFLRKARAIHAYGAAAVVMLFDESGQADVFARKKEVAKRAYDLLMGIGFPPEDIIFDPNVLSVATGIEEHDGYGVDFIEACRWIKANLPHAKVSGGVSNLSFSFRGNNAVREAMHSVFLYHAVAAGMDMGIVNPAMLQVYSDIPAELLELCEDVVLNRRKDSTERLAAYAEKIKGTTSAATEKQQQEWRMHSVEQRIEHAMVKGVTDFIEEDTMEAYREQGTPLGVIDNVLMPAMNKVGELFGSGQMFLPQVVKSARVMKKAVGVLTPFIEEGSGTAQNAGKVVIATVKGDVHDIGKNIVSVVMSCNGYQIDDMGVMVECEKIVDRAQEIGASAVALSGLITPSLDEMIKVVEEMERRGMKTPVIVGGATTSKMHTAVKIAPKYSGVVVQSPDASENIKVLAGLFGVKCDQFAGTIKESQESLRTKFEQMERQRKLRPLAEARMRRHVKLEKEVIAPNRTGRVVFSDYPIAQVEKYINWNYFFSAWGLKGRYPDLLDSAEKGEEARKLFADAQAMLEELKRNGKLKLNGVLGIFPAVSDGDDIVVDDTQGGLCRMAMLRNQSADRDVNESLADYLCAEGDYVGAFAVTSGVGLKELSDTYKAEGDEYSAIMVKLIADRLAEAFAEAVHAFIRTVMWSYEAEGELSPEQILHNEYKGKRMAFGYAAVPDHSLKREVFDLLDVTAATGMTLTSNWMITPGEAVCGLVFADPKLRYFAVGDVTVQQLEEYAQRRQMEAEEIARIIAHN